jgi:hypothetical protein
MVSRQVTPKFVEVQTGPLATHATIFEPSADEAIESQKSVAERAVQVIPELGQVWGRPPKTTAANSVPSPEHVTEAQARLGALLEIHVAPEFVEL